MRPRHLELRHSSIGEGLSPDETDNYDVEHAGDDATASIHTTRRIYSPHGRWAWADGLSIDDSEDLMPLECEKNLVQFQDFIIYLVVFFSWIDMFHLYQEGYTQRPSDYIY